MLLSILLTIPFAGTAAQTLLYDPNLGPNKVRTVDQLVLHDAARNKDVPVKIYYPEGPGPFPVIIFSHGLYGSKDGYFALGQYWASYGYVSIHPSHDDSLRDGTYRGTLRQALNNSDLWQSRPEDISFVIDSLPDIEKRLPDLRGKFDPKRLGVGGHSYGAYTAQAIGGATVQMPGKSSPRSFADRRVKAIIILSPQGEGQMGLTAQSWTDMKLPMLIMYGSRDFGSQHQTPTWRSEPFFKAPPGDKYDVELEGATHMTFAGPFRPGRAENDLFKCVKLESVAFWDAYLKGAPAAKSYLQSDALKAFSNSARIDHK
jgi:predicted dienelactone hydrolase